MKNIDRALVTRRIQTEEESSRTQFAAGPGLCEDSTPWSQPAGPPGDTPPRRSEPSPNTQPGSEGMIDQGASVDLDLIATLSSPSHIAMMLNKCALDCINENFDPALDRLLWIRSVTKAALALPGQQMPAEADLLQYRNSLERANVLISQIRLGLDYYAEPLNYVPLVSIKFYTDLLRDLLTNARDIQDAYLSYKNVAQNQEKAIEALTSARTHAFAEIQRLNTASSELVAQQDPLNDAIVRLEETLNELWVELMAAEDDFKRAVAATRGGGCSFNQIVTIAAAVATLVASGGTAAPAIALALTALEKKPLFYEDKKPVQDDFQGFKYKVNTVVQAGKDVQSFVDAFDKIKDAIVPKDNPSPAVPELPGDEAKIVAEEADIERQLEPFMDMDEAKRYKALIRAFVSTSEAKNNKILEYNNNILAWRRIVAEIRQIQIELDASQDAIARTTNPFVPEAENFMLRSWIESKNSIIKVIYQISKAYKYYALRDISVNIQDFAVQAIEATANAVLSSYADAKERYGSQPSNIIGMEIDLTPFFSTDSWNKFVWTGRATVSVHPDAKELMRYSNVLVTKVGLRLVGKGGPAKTIQATLYHEGRALIFDQAGVQHTFSHVPVSIPYEMKDGVVVVDGSVATGENGDYEGLSPYGPWTIRVDAGEPGFFKELSRVALVFDGKARGRA